MFRKAIGGTVHEIIPITNTPLFLTTVIPSSNTISTAFEMSRFAEIWRRGGELDGVRVHEPARRCGRDAAMPPAAAGCRDRSCAGSLGHRLHAGHQRGSARSGGTRRPRSGISAWSTAPSGPTPTRGLSAGVISSGKPGRDPEVKRYTALMDTITARSRRLRHSRLRDGEVLQPRRHSVVELTLTSILCVAAALAASGTVSFSFFFVDGHRLVQ